MKKYILNNILVKLSYLDSFFSYLFPTLVTIYGKHFVTLCIIKSCIPSILDIPRRTVNPVSAQNAHCTWIFTNFSMYT
jgi:hypothetical protein